MATAPLPEARGRDAAIKQTALFKELMRDYDTNIAEATASIDDKFERLAAATDQLQISVDALVLARQRALGDTVLEERERPLYHALTQHRLAVDIVKLATETLACNVSSLIDNVCLTHIYTSPQTTPFQAHYRQGGDTAVALLIDNPALGTGAEYADMPRVQMIRADMFM